MSARFAWLMAMLALLPLPAARAQEADPVGYRDAIDGAIREFSARNFEEARSLFARADKLYPNARTQRGLGLADYELRDYVACIQHFEAALASTTKPLDDELRSQTQELLARAEAFVGRYLVTTEPTRARLSIDGDEKPWASGQRVTLNTGKHVLRLEAVDYFPQEKSLQVKGGDEGVLRFELAKAAVVDSSRERLWYESPWLWAAVSVVVVGSATAAIFAASSGARASDIDSGSAQFVLTGP